VNTTKHTEVNHRRTLVATAIAYILVVACTAVAIGSQSAAAAQPQAAEEYVRVYKEHQGRAFGCLEIDKLRVYLADET